MKKILIAFAAMFLASSQVEAGQKLSLKDVTSRALTAKAVSGITPIDGTDLYASISDDGKQIVQSSFKTGKQTAVLFDVNHTIGEKISEFDGYIMSPDGKRMLIRTQTEPIYRRSYKAVFYIYTIASRKLERLSEGGPQQSPVWSPDGMQVAFVRDNNIFLVKLLYDNAESQVTKDGKRNEVINGIPDWVNEEEFSFNCSMTFTADGQMLCWLRYDESQVKTFSLQMYGQLYPEDYSYKYPKAGEKNSTVTAWSYDIQSHKTRQLQIPTEQDGYMPRIKATSDANKIIVYTMNRHQDELRLYSVNPRSTMSQLLIKEHVDKYVKEEAMENIRIGKDAVLLPSDRDGWMHLYLFNMNGQMLRKVESGNYEVTDVYGYDDQTGDVYYQAAVLNAHDRQVYVAHKNGKIERLTNQEGWNSALFSGDYKYFVNNWSDLNTPNVYTLRGEHGKVVQTLESNQELRKLIQEKGYVKREMFSFTTSEGIKLDGWMLKPADFNPAKKYPVIMSQYSGPGSQQVFNGWFAGSMGNGGAFDQYLVQHGFIVVSVDGRGTGGRGAAFEKCTYLHLGELESKDQVETAIYLGTLPYVDKEHIGIWGWSYGGFNTLMSMSEGREVFCAGVAVAPPTNWKFYDSVYTERYMRTPKENPDGYSVNPISRAENLHGALLVCHGTADDNVHPQNTYEYTTALVEAEKDFHELLYTNKNHSIRGEKTRNHLLGQICKFFIKELKK